MTDNHEDSGCGNRQNCPNPCEESNPGHSEPVTVIEFETLARGAKVVCVTYRGQCYQLRSTRNGKLILNK